MHDRLTRTVTRTASGARFVAMPVVAALVVGGLAGCGGSDDPDRLLVFAAASLAEPFDELARQFEASHPAVDVTVTIGSSAQLREQVLDGAPVDVVALASIASAEPLVDARALLGEPVTFASNTLVLAVPAGNPGRVTSLDDLANPELFVGICAAGVPCGDLAVELATRAGVDLAVDTEAPDARALLTLVATGELDAGLVYASDAQGSAVEVIELPPGVEVATSYPIAVAAGSSERELAAEFVDLVTGDSGRAVLAAHGLGPP